MRRWEEERERSRMYERGGESRSSHEYRPYGEPRRPDREERMGHELYDRDDRRAHSSSRRDDDGRPSEYRGEEYQREGFRGQYDRQAHRGSGSASDPRQRYDDRYEDNRRRYDEERRQQAERTRSTYESSRRDDDDWDDRPRISGPVRPDPPARSEYRDHGRYGRHEGERRDMDRGRPGTPGERAEDFEQYRGRDHGFSWADGSNSATWREFDGWGNEYTNHSRREGIGWNRGSTRDQHFWSSPDRDR